MDDAETSIALAPLPTEKTLRARKSLPVQMVRFIAINIKMIRIIAKGHH
jgi:hypothetical protein